MSSGAKRKLKSVNAISSLNLNENRARLYAAIVPNNRETATVEDAIINVLTK
jgi:hypothetical protein